jgi:uncharacterized protein (TIGR00159 family)
MALIVEKFSSVLLGISNTFSSFNSDGRNIVDVILLGLIIYLLIQFFREAQLVPVVIGIFSVVLVYGSATILDLPLTQLILRSFFGIFLILLAIIFQKELRRFFSSLGFWGAFRTIVPESRDTLEIISQTVAKFANHKIGAILVFPGRELLGRQLEGGHLLRGEISEPLLFSIFDTSSPGHDGAVIIENNRIERFGVHLPLAEKMERVENFGLRHRAALGLAENSDALVIVVSEEKALISVAWKGELHHVSDEDALLALLSQFQKTTFPKRSIMDASQWFIQNVAMLAFAMTISLGIWVFVNSGSQFALVQRNFAVTPEFQNTSDAFFVQNFSPQTVSVTLEGRSLEFDSLRPESLKVVLDLDSVQDIGRQQVVVSESSVHVPHNFSVIHIDPPILLLNIKKAAAVH